MKQLLTLIFVLYSLVSQAQIWKPESGYTQIPIWPKGKMQDPLLDSKQESVTTGNKLIAGKPVTIIWNVTEPTMTLYFPVTKNTGATVVVFPGGGFNGLAIDLEGTEICEWLITKGVTCVLLKYRVPDSGPAWHDDCQCHIHPKAPTALQDAQRTLGLLRRNASEWHINPNKIGVLGFSAGGYMVADISTHFKQRAYTPVDEADKESCRPDFAIAFYPGHMQMEGKKFELNPEVHFTKETPPTFLLQAEDDPVDDI